MPKTHPPYTPEFRRQMVDLVRAGRSPDELAREFERTAQSICAGVAKADRQEGRREATPPGLAAAERDELVRLRREFYEYTTPSTPKIKLKDRHLFTMAGEPWFWIAGIVRDACFTMLTTAPGPDVAPYHDRQIVTLAPADGVGWLSPFGLPGAVLRIPPADTFQVRTLRASGVDAG